MIKEIEMHLRKETVSKIHHDILQNPSYCPDCDRIVYPSGLEISAVLIRNFQKCIGRVIYYCVECDKHWNNELIYVCPSIKFK